MDYFSTNLSTMIIIISAKPVHALYILIYNLPFQYIHCKCTPNVYYMYTMLILNDAQYSWASYHL